MNHAAPDPRPLAPLHPARSLLRINASGAADAARAWPGPVSALVELRDAAPGPTGAAHACLRLLALGTPAEVDAHEAAPAAQVLDRPGHVLIPGLVNAHTHLDLTHVGPVPHDPSLGFRGFAAVVVSRRPKTDADIEAAVRSGIEKSLRGGVVAVGDIAGVAAGSPTLAPYRALRRSPLAGVSYVEFFGSGPDPFRGFNTAQALLEEVENRGPLRAGLQPHAPYSVERPVYHAATALAAKAGVPISTHLAENAQEREFITRGTGPLRQFLESIGIWNDRFGSDLGHAPSPIQHLAPVLREAPFLLAHVLDVSDKDLAVLAECKATVAYCPRGAEYFENHAALGPHRYRDMIKAGVPVALGTDSIVNLPQATAAADGRMSTLDEARRLFARDSAPPDMLFTMMTTAGARALGLAPKAFTLAQGVPLAGLSVVQVGTPATAADPRRMVLEGDGPIELLCSGNLSG